MGKARFPQVSWDFARIFHIFARICPILPGFAGSLSLQSSITRVYEAAAEIVISGRRTHFSGAQALR
jgi:hypothetical protein